MSELVEEHPHRGKGEGDRRWDGEFADGNLVRSISFKMQTNKTLLNKKIILKILWEARCLKINMLIYKPDGLN